MQNKVIYSALANKQNKLTAGTGISIENNVISATASGQSGDDTDLSEEIERIKEILINAELYDPNALNEKFTPAQSGTILQTQDTYETILDVDADNSNEILLPNVLCSTNTQITANVTFTITFKPISYGDISFEYYDNGTLLGSENYYSENTKIGYYSDHIYEISNYQCTTNSHNFYVVMKISDLSNMTINL